MRRPSKSIPKTELSPSTQLRKVAFGGSLKQLNLRTLLAIGSIAIANSTLAAVPRFAPHEVVLTATGTYANPYTELTADVVLTRPDGAATRALPMFWDGGSMWRFRFAPDQTGAWKWSVKSPDAGLNGKSGAFECVASELKGGLRPMTGFPRHFQRQDGSPAWFMGDTAWALVTDDAQEKCDRTSVERYLQNRAAQGFNAVSTMLLNEAGWSNQGGPPWNSLAVEQINPAYWQEADARIAFANAQGITVGLALAWGEKTAKEKYPWGKFPSLDARKRYTRYIGARYGAYDTYFLVSGEWHGEVKTRSSTAEEMKREFFGIGDALQAANIHGRMIGIHPMTVAGSTREYNDAGWMSFGDYQQNYFELHTRVLDSRRFEKPVVNGEYGYYLRDADGDGIVDKHHSYTVEDMRNATWDIAMAGGYVVTGFGSTYMGGHRHPTNFLPDDPKNAPWVEQIGLIKKCFTALDWWKLEPHDELISCATSRGKDRNRRLEIGDKQRTMNQAPATTYWCLAELGKQYVLYARGLKEPVSLKLPDASAATARLFDPRTGEFKDLDGVTGQERFEFTPPDERDWIVMLLKR